MGAPTSNYPTSHMVEAGGWPGWMREGADGASEWMEALR